MDERFIENFKNGFPFLKVVSAATPQRGITILSEEQQQSAIAEYEAFKGKCREKRIYGIIITNSLLLGCI